MKHQRHIKTVIITITKEINFSETKKKKKKKKKKKINKKKKKKKNKKKQKKKKKKKKKKKQPNQISQKIYPRYLKSFKLNRVTKNVSAAACPTSRPKAWRRALAVESEDSEFSLAIRRRRCW
jgi:hypothetical protein